MNRPPNLPDLACAEVEDMLPLVVDGVLDTEDEPALFEHLARCPDCQASLVRYDLVDLALGAGTALAPAKPIRFHRLHWSAAALWLLGVGLLGGGIWWNLRDADPATATAITVEVVGERPIGGGERSFLLRVGDDLIETDARDSVQERQPGLRDHLHDHQIPVGRRP